MNWSDDRSHVRGGLMLSELFIHLKWFLQKNEPFLYYICAIIIFIFAKQKTNSLNYYSLDNVLHWLTNTTERLWYVIVWHISLLSRIRWVLDQCSVTIFNIDLFWSWNLFFACKWIHEQSGDCLKGDHYSVWMSSQRAFVSPQCCYVNILIIVNLSLFYPRYRLICCTNFSKCLFKQIECICCFPVLALNRCRSRDKGLQENQVKQKRVEQSIDGKHQQKAIQGLTLHYVTSFQNVRWETSSRIPSSSLCEFCHWKLLLWNPLCWNGRAPLSLEQSWSTPDRCVIGISTGTSFYDLYSITVIHWWYPSSAKWEHGVPSKRENSRFFLCRTSDQFI